jgi:hypothetical protein
LLTVWPGVGYDLLVWGTLEMQMAIICASAPAMKGFFSGLAQTVSVRYGSRTRHTERINSYPLTSKNSPGTGTGSGTGDLLQREEHLYNEKWDDADLEPWNSGKTSHEMLTVPGRKARVQDGGMLITETFGVEKGSDPYAKERRILGI